MKLLNDLLLLCRVEIDGVFGWWVGRGEEK